MSKETVQVIDQLHTTIVFDPEFDEDGKLGRVKLSQDKYGSITKKTLYEVLIELKEAEGNRTPHEIINEWNLIGKVRPEFLIEMMRERLAKEGYPEPSLQDPQVPNAQGPQTPNAQDSPIKIDISFFFASDQEEIEASWGRMRRLGSIGGGSSMYRVQFHDGVPHELHYHPHQDEIVYVASGRIEQTIDTETRILNVGDSAVIPRNVPHSARPLEPSTEVIVALAGDRYEYIALPKATTT